MMVMRVGVSQGTLDNVEKILGKKDKRGPEILRKAVRETADECVKRTREALRGRYITKAKPLRKGIYRRDESAPAGQPAQAVVAKSEQMELMDFRVTPPGYSPKNRPKAYKAKVLRGGGAKPLQRSDGLKAFVAEFSNGHKSVVQRRPEGRAPRRSRLGKRYVKKLLGPSLPSMVKNEKVWPKVKADTGNFLQERVFAHMKEMLGG